MSGGASTLCGVPLILRLYMRAFPQFRILSACVHDRSTVLALFEDVKRRVLIRCAAFRWLPLEQALTDEWRQEKQLQPSSEADPGLIVKNRFGPVERRHPLHMSAGFIQAEAVAPDILNAFSE